MPRYFVLIGLLVLAASSGCRNADPGKDVASALDGHRFIAPSVSRGLAMSMSCTWSADFIPVILCAESPDRGPVRELRRTLGLLELSGERGERLESQTALYFATGSAGFDEIRQLAASIQQSLSHPMESDRRARLLTDLSAAYLLMAEETQSAVEVLASLEAALEAQELEPLAEARFNQDLALVLLGVHQPEDVEHEPRLRELAEQLQSEAVGPSDDSGCPTARDVGTALDEWGEDPPAHRDRLRVIAACLEKAEDRFLPDVLAAARSNEASTAKSWQDYRAGQRAMFSGSPREFDSRMSELQKESSPAPLRIAARYFSGAYLYASGDLSQTETALRGLVPELEGRSYFGLLALAQRMLAIVAEVRGEYRLAIERANRAMQAAALASAPELVAALQSQQARTMELRGRDVEAWRFLSQTLRQLDPKTQPVLRPSVVATASRLARRRDLPRSSLALQSLAIEGTRKANNTPALIGEILARGKMLGELGELDAARVDRDEAAGLFEPLRDRIEEHKILHADLDYLTGLTEFSIPNRRQALVRSFETLDPLGHAQRIAAVQLALARTERADGRKKEAESVLGQALARLSGEVANTPDWSMATSLVEAARPMVEESVDLALEATDAEAIRSAVAAYLDLRSGAGLHAVVAPPRNTSRWTIFALSEVLIHIVESESAIELVQVSVPRERLKKLRKLLLAQLSSGVAESAIHETATELGHYTYQAVEHLLLDANQLTIIADEALTGIPFAILPADTDQILLDRFTISYATNLRSDSFAMPSTVLAVGATGVGSDLSLLPRAEAEATEIARFYASSRILTGPEATPEQLLGWLKASDSGGGWEPIALHVASHFEVDTRSPLDSALVLNQVDERLGRLSLRALLRQRGSGIGLLYLSACSTGTSLPVEPHGLHSLAQAFKSAGISRSVLSLWRLDDEAGAEMATEFHRQSVAGTEPALALRHAQQVQRDRGRHPGIWSALALYR